MKKTILLLLLLSLVTVCEAQNKYCLSYLDYLTDTWFPLEQLRFEYRSGNRSLWWEGSNFKPRTGDKKTDKLLKKKARFIMYNDSLYVNCREMKVEGNVLGNWYSSAMAYDRGRFLFIALSTNARSNTAGAAFMFGLIGGAIAASTNNDNYQCYVLSPTSAEDAFVEPIDEKFMLKLLEGHDDLLAEYKAASKEQNCYSPNVVIPILKKLGLVK